MPNRKMSTSRSRMQDENGNTRVVGTNGRDELPNYAEDALKEVLGWYGLHEGHDGQQSRSSSGRHYQAKTGSRSSVGAGCKNNTVTSHADETAPNERTDNEMVAGNDSGSVPSAKDAKIVLADDKADSPVDLTNGHVTLADMTNTSGSMDVKSNGVGHRKLIGMRFLFPPLSDDVPLMERAKIWVRRHDYKYFVGWSEDELKTIDPILRPLAVITPELYKLHMNRSEYCRNVKLKYCLESDADWAQEFREKVKKPPSEGGFTGLCQAKIAAAELWRKYSEKYRSHQARYPNPKSRYKMKKQSATSNAASDYDASSKHRMSADEEGEDEAADSSQDAKRVRFDEDIDIDEDDNMDPNRINYESDECHEIDEAEYRQKLLSEAGNHAAKCSMSPRVKEEANQEPLPNDSDDKSDHTEEKASCATDASTCGSPKKSVGADSLSSRSYYPRLAPAQFLGMPFSPYPGGMAQFTIVGTQNEYPADGSLNSVKLSSTTSEIMPSPSAAMATSGFTKPRHSDRHHEYKRSERGLSFLFPSLSDHNLSLIDKVRITVIRHKNNYFLGKTEEELGRVDPLIRPKMVVTPEIYKEYCHRNAMKYDSNLQFAMESPETWAEEFRAKLMRPPSEGGFSSLCEVKLEAGRLWREFSGKYRMHNIVKWQMDLNSTGKGIKHDPDDGSEPPRLASQRRGSFQEPTSPSEASDQDLAVTPTFRVPSPQSSIESGDMQPVAARTAFNGDAGVPTKANSVLSPQTVSSEMATGSGVLDLHVKTPVPKLDPSPHSQYEGSQDSSPKRYLRSPKHNVKYSVVRDLPPECLSSAAYQFDGPLQIVFTGDSNVNSAVVSDLSKAQRISDMNAGDALFKHLPQTMSVAQQLSIWLERYRHNFFLGYRKEELSSLGEYLRPNMVVTKEVFNKYVPESMVDVISKIELIMLSNEPWAIEFQEKVHKSPRDGGFSKFEDAITDAVMLWNLAKMSYQTKHSQQDVSGRAGLASGNHLDVPLDLHGSGSQAIKSDVESLSRYCPPSKHDAASTPAEPGTPPVNVITKQEQPAGKQEETVVPPRGLHPARLASPGRERSHSVFTSHDWIASQRFDGRTSVGLLSLLWAIRERLQQQCADDPHRSWADRLQPHLPMLRAILGPSYVLPATTTSCVVDFILCMLHQHIECVASLTTPRRDLACKKQDAVSEASS